MQTICLTGGEMCVFVNRALLTYHGNCQLQHSRYCKTLFFRRILIFRFPYVENLLHFNFADFPVDFIKQFVSYFFWCLKQMLLSKFVPYITVYIKPTKNIAYIISRKSWYSKQTKSWWWAIQKISVYLISRFYSNRENFMLANIRFTVHCKRGRC